MTSPSKEHPRITRIYADYARKKTPQRFGNQVMEIIEDMRPEPRRSRGQSRDRRAVIRRIAVKTHTMFVRVCLDGNPPNHDAAEGRGSGLQFDRIRVIRLIRVIRGCF